MRGVDRKTGLFQVVIACLVLLVSGLAAAASPEAAIRDLGSKMELYQGSWNKPEPPPDDETGWVSVANPAFSTSDIDKPIWLRANLEDLDLSRQHWLILHPYAQRVNVYVDGKPTTPEPLHFFAPMDERPVPHHFLVSPIPTFSEGESQNHRLHLRLEPFFPVNTFFRLADDQGLVKELTLHTALGFSLMAVIVIMAIYNLFLYFSTRDTVYLWYVAASCASLAYSAMLTNISAYVIADWGMPPKYGFLAGSSALLLQFLLFQRLLETKTAFPKVHLAVNAVLAIGAVLLIASPWISQDQLVGGMLVLGHPTYILVLGVASARALNGYHPARYFLLGWVPFVASLFMTTFEYMGLTEPTSWVSYYLPVGLSWEMALFSLALASRIKILRDDRNALQARQIEVSEKARKALERSNQIKDEFLNAVSHELRTPLHTIQGQLDLMREAPLNSEQDQAFRTLESANLRMTRQVGGILDFVDAQSDNLVGSPQVFEPRSLADLLSYELAEAARAKPLSLSVGVAANVPQKVFMDGLMLEKTLFQLIDNAVKFTPAKGQVVVWCEKEQGQPALTISITDTGPGIPAEKRDKVFQAFEQGETGLTRRYAGMGLGLPLANSLALALGGAIRVISSTENGTTMELRVPFGEIHLSPPDTNEPFPNDRDTHSPRVLVVEDDGSNRMILRKQLKAMGVTSEGVQNGLEALNSAMKEPWDLIIMDCQMPVMDGIEATRRIRQEAIRNLGTPIIALTANASASYRKQCLDAGMNEYCTKPLSMEKLEMLVHSYTEHRTKRQYEPGQA
ncbi:7TM diverse intracellular signaling domain-containing protein [Marinobacter sp. 2_MG-2023]|uniref:7TM diverse intracellular signaling domain-containing protein n=1 Tax=Marinobacter sp. 2_MG-2023 TaxID=3062679 RepID=UPI0026E48FB5|nr:7TM diverse intracellular signaling domain-containing protein [Marinobacter sp. 2_MG-2023]MDO6441813.1 7TM diverse intracellular signaling domain-containing protein [Marinobacter sp. 2_MG-2023]